MAQTQNELVELNIVEQKPTGWKPFVIRDINDKKVWPKHLEDLLACMHDDVSIHFVGAVLGYILFIEAGFVPSPESEGLPDADPAEIAALRLNEFMLRFGSKKPSAGFKKDCLAVRFKVIVDHNDISRPTLIKEVYSQDQVNSHSDIMNRRFVDNPLLSVTNVDNNHPSTNTRSDASVMNQGLTLSTQDNRPLFRYSNEIKVVFLVQNEGVEICVNEWVNKRAIVNNYRLNILQFCQPLDCMVDGRARKMPVIGWLKEIVLDGAKLSSTFKREFVMGILDRKNGISQELRGIQSLPPEVLLHTMKMCETKTVTRLARTSCYLRSVTQNQGLWEYLVNRDYPINARTESQLSVSLNKSDRSMKHRYRRLFDDEIDMRRLKDQRNDSSFWIVPFYMM